MGRNIINTLIKEILNETNTAFITSASGKTTAISYQDKKELDSIKPNPDIKKIETSSGQKLKEMARTSEVFYRLKPDYVEDLEAIKPKLSRAEYRTLLDVVKVLRDENRHMDAQELMRVHNENNPDRIYKNQQGFIRPLVINAIKSGKITYDDLPFTSGQEDRRQNFEKIYNIPSKSIKYAKKYDRNLINIDTVSKFPKYTPNEMLENTIKYKSLREKYFTYKNKSDNESKKELSIIIRRINELLTVPIAVSLLYQWENNIIQNVLDQPLKDFARANDLLKGSTIEGLTPEYFELRDELLDDQTIKPINKREFTNKKSKKEPNQPQPQRVQMSNKDIEDYYKSIGMDPNTDDERKMIYVGDTKDLEKGLYDDDWNFEDEY